MHAEMWHDRLRDEPRFRKAVEELWPYALGVLPAELRGELVSRVGLAEVEAIERGTHTDELAPMWEEMTMRAAVGAVGSAVVAEAQVWEALEEIPDPEIPVVSLVDLGVIRSVDVEDGHVRIEFTPTFLGCPALEVMKRAMEEKVAELGAEPEVEVISDDSWSTDRITPAGREKLRAAGFAPPAPREASAPKLVQLQANVFRCPYCGSTETRLENIFGPTPCRSLRYCESCRQPFEQFKTI